MRKLTKDEIEVKVKQVCENGAVLLLYKTARVDMAILDEVYGSMNWQSDYKVVKDNLYGGIGVLNKDTKEWIWKWDCGIESRNDEEGNQKKGEASDAFKRAGYKWGIGVELYSTPFIFANVQTKEMPKLNPNAKAKYTLSNPFQKFYVKEIGYNDIGDISQLVIVDDKGVEVYSYGKGNKPTSVPKQPKEDLKADISRCIASINSKKTLYIENSPDYNRIMEFTNKLYSAGLKDEALNIQKMLADKTQKPYMADDGRYTAIKFDTNTGKTI